MSAARAAEFPPVTQPVRVTEHACLRYAQRVLGLELDPAGLRSNPDLRGRCERGVARLFDRALLAGEGAGVQTWIAGTRALLVNGGHVVTVLVAPTGRGFSKRFLRRRQFGPPRPADLASIKPRVPISREGHRHA